MTAITDANLPAAASLPRRDRLIVVAGLTIISAGAWGYLVYDAWRMKSGAGCCSITAIDARTWGMSEITLLFVMWAVMMIAMMAPSVAPLLVTFAAVNRRRREADQPYTATGIFLSGYLFAWVLYSLAASVLQWALHAAALLSTEMVGTSAAIGGATLMAAGLFQLTPFKNACLTQCRSPLSFIMTEWRTGLYGTFQMGLRNGMYCLGCCWILMLMLFVTGVMNLLWVAVITSFVLLERIAPARLHAAQLGGLALIGWGSWMLIRGYQ